MKHFRRLHDFTAGREHGRISQAALHELQAHEPVVDARKGRAGELDHVDLDALARQLVQERGDQVRRVLPPVNGAVDQVDAEHTQRLLLARGRRVAQVSMEDHLGRLLVRSGLEPDAEPAAPGAGATVASRLHGVGDMPTGTLT